MLASNRARSGLTARLLAPVRMLFDDDRAAQLCSVARHCGPKPLLVVWSGRVSGRPITSS
jgi:hypothetical protein